MEDRSAIIVDYKRTPFQPASKGSFNKTRPDDLLALVLKTLAASPGIKPADVEDVLVGCAFPEAEQGLNVARLATILAGLPDSAAAATVNRFCGSSMYTGHIAAGAIATGSGDIFISAGVESMSRVPIPGFNPMPNPLLMAGRPEAYIGMGETAEHVARQFGVGREEQEIFALVSHEKAASAQKEGRFKDEIIPVQDVAEDGCIRGETTLEALAGLKPAFDQKGTVTAGTSSPLTDGAAGVLIVSGAVAKERNLKGMATIKSMAVAGCDPKIMGIGPIAASKKALARAGIAVADLGVVELNEAFASQSLACIKELNLDPRTLNIDGGAIALGHPLGATGARILGKAASLLQREGKQFALVTQCIGGGQGIATVLEAV